MRLGPLQLLACGAVLLLLPGAASGGAQADAATRQVLTAYGWPIAPEPDVLTPFAPPANRYGSGHRGVDLAGSEGATIRAAGDAVVIFAGTLVDRGVISLQHAGGLRTTYEPVIASVTKGMRVRAGQTIGRLQTGHRSCAPARCLHWGAKIGEVYLNPLSLLGPLRVRLKPWGGLADTPP